MTFPCRKIWTNIECLRQHISFALQLELWPNQRMPRIPLPCLLEWHCRANQIKWILIILLMIQTFGWKEKSNWYLPRKREQQGTTTKLFSFLRFLILYSETGEWLIVWFVSRMGSSIYRDFFIIILFSNVEHIQHIQ